MSPVFTRPPIHCPLRKCGDSSLAHASTSLLALISQRSHTYQNFLHHERGTHHFRRTSSQRTRSPNHIDKMAKRTKVRTALHLISEEMALSATHHVSNIPTLRPWFAVSPMSGGETVNDVEGHEKTMSKVLGTTDSTTRYESERDE